MDIIIHDEDIFGYFLNNKNRWTYSQEDFKEFQKYNYYKQLKKEQLENEQIKNEQLKYNMSYQNNYKFNKIKTNTNGQNLSLHQNIFIGIDVNGFNHYSNLNENGSFTYYYVDKSGLYYYYQ